jgi:hypothetical protein
MATKQDIRNEGFRRGQNVASWVDLPAIGDRIRPDVDWVGLGRYVTEANRFDYWELLAQSQSYGIPDQFCGIIKPYDVADVFREGVEAGIRAYGRRHHKQALSNAKQEI